LDGGRRSPQTFGGRKICPKKGKLRGSNVVKNQRMGSRYFTNKKMNRKTVEREGFEKGNKKRKTAPSAKNDFKGLEGSNTAAVGRKRVRGAGGLCAVRGYDRNSWVQCRIIHFQTRKHPGKGGKASGGTLSGED